MSTANDNFTELVTQVAVLIDILLETFAADDGGTDDVGNVDITDITAQGLERYARQVESIALMAESGELIGLSQVCRRYQQALEQFAGCSAALSEPIRLALEEWPTLVMAYLEAPTDTEASAVLVAHLQNSAWALPLAAEDAELLRQLLVQQVSTIPAEAAIASLVPDAVAEPGLPEDALAVAGLEAMAPPLADCATAPELTAYHEEREDSTIHTTSALADSAVCDSTPAPEPEALTVVTDVTSLKTSSDDTDQVDAVWPSTVDDEILADGTAGAISDTPDLTPTTLDATLASLTLVQSAYVSPSDGLAAACSEDRQAAYEVPSEALAACCSDDRQEVLLAEPGAMLSEEEAMEFKELDAPAQKLIGLLSLEVTQLAAALEEALGVATHESWRQELVDHTEEIERFGGGAAALGLRGLQQVSEYIRVHLLSLVAQEQPLSEAQRQVVVGWPGPVLRYLQGLYVPASRAALVQYLQDPHWPQPLSQAEGAALREALVVASLDTGAEEQEPRQDHARLADIALTLPEDVNPALLDSLLQDLPQQAADFSAAIQRLTSGVGTLADVNVAQRVAHTLKGAANTVGIPGIANLTHHLEDILLALAEHGTLPTLALNQTLIKAADCLEAMGETLVGMSPPLPEEETLGILQEILDWANLIDQEGVPSDDTSPPVRDIVPELAPQAAPVATDVPRQETITTGGGTRIDANLVDELLRLASEAMVLNGQLQDRLKRTVQQMRALHTQNTVLQQLVWDLEQLVDVHGVTSPLLQHTAQGEFDPLELEQYNELHTVSRRLLEAVADAREIEQEMDAGLVTLDGLLTDQRRVQQDNEKTIMRLRMVPIKTVAQRLQRGVRQACRLTGKEAELVLGGAETLMDSNVLTSMLDPLLHLLRNAVDHGIERPEERERLGKPRVGTIALDFVREGNTIVVRCHDDGAGLHYAAIRQTAIKRGLIDAQQLLAEEELGRLILQPGFSTQTHTTQVSGRGIGMDIVYSRVQELKGALHLTSEANKGCLVELRLPVSLLSTHGLLVRANQQVLAISSLGVEQILYPGAGILMQVGHTPMYQLGEDIHATTTLEALLNLAPEQSCEPEAPRPALLIREDTGRSRVVFVQEIIGSLTLVVKNLGRYIPTIKGIVGATILGDGSVTPVLDLPDLLRGSAPACAETVVHEQVTTDVASTVPRALVVDDSLSARRALAEFVRDLGFEVQTAGDGLEAVALLEHTVPDILLIDLEMPRMNGLELTAHVRSRSTTMHLPVLMVTSRSAEKHRRSAMQAGVNVYLVKPFAEDELAMHIQRLMTQRRAA
jgi:chemosensory pili system protein ChpA (sensor histidine kinase/response regulator)